MDLVKARSITVSGKLQGELWSQFRNTEAGSEEADNVLAQILKGAKHRNEIYLISCNARPGGEVHKKAMQIVMRN